MIVWREKSIATGIHFAAMLLPVHHLRGFWTAIIDEAPGEPVAYAELDSYD